MFYKNQIRFYAALMTTKKTKAAHGGRRVGAGRKAANGRVLLTVRIDRQLRAKLAAQIGRERGALTRCIETLISEFLSQRGEKTALS